MRSYSGCLTCRRRKLKCDEQKPRCGQCAKGSRECVFCERIIFRDAQGQPLCPVGGNDAPAFGFQESQTWVDVPRRLTFIRIDDPYETDMLPCLSLLEEQLEARDLHLLYGDGGFDQPEELESGEHHFDYEPSHHSPVTVSHDDQDAASALDSPETQAKENIVVLHLLRKFREGPGYWMDVFDTGAYFSHKVPVMAASKPLLKSAVCAYAAKYLHHHKTRHLRDSDVSSTPVPASRETSSSADPLPPPPPLPPPGIPPDIDWQYQAAKHYDRALAQLRSAVQLRLFESDGSAREELFATVAVLCAYELMNAPGTAWRAHLSALPLFTSEPASATPEGDGGHFSPVTIPRAAISGPIFWALARQDLLCAFLSETQTRLDLDDICLWQNAGLFKHAIPRLLLSSNPTSSSTRSPSISLIESGDIHTAADVEEDTRSNEIHWLLGKIANFISSGDALNPECYALPAAQRSPIGVTQAELLKRWRSLTRELQRWKSTLPPSFQPIARTALPRLAGFERIWYEAPICAATMQSYHMAAILLLVNQPQESTAVRSTVSNRLQSYRQGEREALLHARELCGTCLAGPPDPVRIHSVQGLSVAGQVFEEPEDLEVVLELLEGIERDLGWTTFHHRTRLKELLEGCRGGRPEWMFL